MKTNIIKLYSLQQQIASLEEECDVIGKDTFGDSFEGCHLEEGVLTIYDDAGHEFDSDEYLFNSEGEELWTNAIRDGLT